MNPTDNSWRRAKKSHTRWNLVPRWNCGLQISSAAGCWACQGACQIHGWSFHHWSEHFAKIHQNLTKIRQNQPKSPKANMLKFGDVSFDLGFERGRMSATGYVAKISMLRLNIGSGMLRLSSCMLSIGRGPKAVQGKGGAAPPCLVRIWVRGQC